jgi:thymidylate synthase (FAD)
MKIRVLDHGYVDFVEAWGKGGTAETLKYKDLYDDNERGIIEAARQSTQGAFRGWNQDAKLLKFLYQNNHATPFEFAGMTVEVQAPIFVFREWQRHRTQSYNEMSARYAPLPDLYYIPTVERVLQDGGANKQAAAVNPMQTDPGLIALQFMEQLRGGYEAAEAEYQQYLQWGIPKELARLIMPVGHYSRMRASANLRNWLAFLTLRMDSRAQWEIQQFAGAVGKVIEEKFPQTWRLFNLDSAGAMDV